MLLEKRGKEKMETPIVVKDFQKRVFVFFLLLIFLLLVGTLGYSVFLKSSLKEGFMLTLETLSFLYHPEGGGLLKALTIFLSLVGVFLVWWVLWGLFDLMLEGNLSKYLKIKSHLDRLRKMKNHYIIAGGGRVGQEIANKLKTDKKEYVIIEKNKDIVSKLKKEGYLAVVGDVSDENILKEHNIEKAKALVLTLPETEKNVMIAMSAKEIVPDIFIYARSDKPNCINKLKKAGADFVIVPELAAAEKILYEMSLRDKR